MPANAPGIHVVGSINIDHVYRLAHLPVAGETLAAQAYFRTLGGKGANQAIAAARAGAQVSMIGAVGEDGGWTRDALAAEGITVTGISEVGAPSGHARIEVDARGENRIIIHGGANRCLVLDQVRDALASARHGDWLLLQNETNLVAEVAALGVSLGMQVAYSAAPFEVIAVSEVLAYVHLLAVNELEATQLAGHLRCDIAALPVPLRLVTRGASGARLYDRQSVAELAAHCVNVVDTTGAGDVFVGYMLAGLAQGVSAERAFATANAAAALQVTRAGAASAAPRAAEVQAFLEACSETP